MFDALVRFLRLESHRGDRPRFEASERDRLAGHFAIAVLAFVETADRAIDLGDELALAVAGAELDAPVGLARRPVGKVRLAQRVDLKLRHGRARFFDHGFLPRLQLSQEIGAVPAAHEFFVFGRAIALRKDDPVEWFEVVAAIKVDKCSRHMPSPDRFPSPLGKPNAAAWLRPGPPVQPEAITADFPGTYPEIVGIPNAAYNCAADAKQEMTRPP